MKVIDIFRSCSLITLGWLSAQFMFTHHSSILNPTDSRIHSENQIIGNSRNFDSIPIFSFISNNSSTHGDTIEEDGTRPSWHRLLDCSIFSFADCFATSGSYVEYPTFDRLPNLIRIADFKNETRRLRHNSLAQDMTFRIDLSRKTISFSTDAHATTGTLSSASISNGGSGSMISNAYESELKALASDAKANNFFLFSSEIFTFPITQIAKTRAVFTMADKNYASHISEVATMAARLCLELKLLTFVVVSTE